MYNVIKGAKVNYNNKTPFVIESEIEDKSSELTNEQEAIVTSEINRRVKEIEKNANVIAEEIIQRAHSEAEQMLEQIRYESAKIFEVKQKEGFEKGLNEAAEKYAVVLENSNKLIEEQKCRFEEEIKKFSDDILDLSVQMAQKITDIEFRRNDEAILAALNKVMEDYKNEKNVIIELSIKNLERLKETELAKKYTLQENKLLGEKDALIDLDNGTIDISMDKQLDNLVSSMEG